MNQPVVQVERLTKYFGTKAVVRDASFSVAQGEVFALLGRNGAGKSTTLRMMLGLLEPTRGRCALFGCDSRGLTPEVRSRIGYLAEGHYLYGWMTIRQLAEFTRETHLRWQPDRFAGFLEYFGLDARERIRDLSNGQRAQVSLAISLACDPELLIMDDPTLGVDAAVRRDFLRGVVDLATRGNRTVIISTHVLADVDRIADRVGILDGGVLRADLSLEAFKSSVVRYRLVFSGDAPKEIRVPRTVYSVALGKEVTLTVVRPGQDTRQVLEGLGAKHCEQMELSLEDAFVDFTSGGVQRRISFGDWNLP